MTRSSTQKATSALVPSKRHKAGRPTREQAEARLVELLDTAVEHFFEKGFELTTIEAIATAVNMTKRTVYARFPDKAALFRAAVYHAIKQLALPPERFRTVRADTLEQTLLNVAWLRVNQVMTPAGLKLYRIINTESYRFPDIFMTAYELGVLPVINFIAELLVEENQAGRLAVDEPHFAANIFVSMVISIPVRVFVSGNYIPREETDRRMRYAIHLFLDGARRRNL